MTVNNIRSVKLTKRGDNLSGTVSRLTRYISKHSNAHLDIVLMAGTNDLFKCDVTPEDLIKELMIQSLLSNDFPTLDRYFYVKPRGGYSSKNDRF